MQRERFANHFGYTTETISNQPFDDFEHFRLVLHSMHSILMRLSIQKNRIAKKSWKFIDDHSESNGRWKLHHMILKAEYFVKCFRVNGKLNKRKFYGFRWN